MVAMPDVRSRLTFFGCEIVGRNRPSKRRRRSGLQSWLSETERIGASFSTAHFEGICSSSSLGAFSVAPFRSSPSGSGNVTCFAVWFPICENILLETLDFRSSFRSPRFEHSSRPPNLSLPTDFSCTKTCSVGDGCINDTDHHRRHPSGHPKIFGRVRRRSSCTSGDDQFGRGQNTGLGWSDPTFVHVSVPKVMRGVAPAQLRGDRAECFVRAAFRSRGPQ
jgi:hypothetical protein